MMQQKYIQYPVYVFYVGHCVVDCAVIDKYLRIVVFSSLLSSLPIIPLNSCP